MIPGTFMMDFAGNNELSDRIIQTLYLADRRGYGLSLAHISMFLYCGEAREEEIRKELSTMTGISHCNDVYCLKGREHLLGETCRRLHNNGTMNGRYEAIARHFASEFASFCPFIECIAIAGSIASDGFSEEDDVDFNIVVKSGCKYTVYLLGILISIKYAFRYRNKPLARRAATPFLPKLICINVIWEDWETLPYARQDKFLAYEILRQKPIFGTKFYSDILVKNRWLETYFPQIYMKRYYDVKCKKTIFGSLMLLLYANSTASYLGERFCKMISYFLWRAVQFSRRNNKEAIDRVRWVTEMQRPYALFGDRI